MAERVHDIALRGFSAGADAYERARPDYPDDAVAAVIEALGLRPGRRVLELGAGTGKLTRRLAPAGGEILALEPVGSMRTRLESLGLPGVAVLDGTAGDVPLATGSVDGAVAAQAFHWFDPLRSVAELHRVIRPGGRAAMVWNLRDESLPWVAAATEAIRAVEGDLPSYRDGRWRTGFDRTALFEPLERHAFRHVQRLDLESFVGRFASVSGVAAAEPEVRTAVLAAVEAIGRAELARSGEGHVELPYDVELHVARRRPDPPSGQARVVAVNISPGGVPKHPVDRAWVDPLGLQGDGHSSPNHGGFEKAVSLYAVEALARVRADGHTAFPGAYGENLTVAGLDWAALGPGDRLEVGDGGLVLELTKPATPCRTIAHWFAEERIERISPRIHPGDARWYASVRADGPVAPDDAVRVVGDATRPPA